MHCNYLWPISCSVSSWAPQSALPGVTAWWAGCLLVSILRPLRAHRCSGSRPSGCSFLCVLGRWHCLSAEVPRHCTHVHSFKAAAISPNLGMDWDPSLRDTDRSWHNLNDQNPLKLKIDSWNSHKGLRDNLEQGQDWMISFILMRPFL